MEAARLRCRALWLLPLLLLCWPAGVQAQDAATRRTLLLKVTPQYVVVSGYWLEVEKSWNQHPNQSFVFTPQVYAGPAGQPNASKPSIEPERTVRGAGLQVQHRWYLSATQAAYSSGVYVSYGPHFQHFAVSYEGQGWEQVEGPNGLPYLEYRSGRHTESINRYGGTVQMGYQAPLHPGRVFLDLYAGIGWRASTSRDGSVALTSQYRSGTSDYGHEGFYFPAGVKIGVALR
ncbi:hypothetical protein [Hymenobacter sp.]|jgi:hypothetical protein|uniref:hypothetical protein n=1 Tax=Hymenobacter sp. TaxID=1898978 RepID=UPI002ED9DA0E